MLSTAKLCCLVTGATSYYIALTPPNPAPTANDKVYRGQLFDKIIRGLARATKMAGLLAFTIEFLVVATVAFPHTLPYPILPALCGRTPDPLSLLSISPSFVIGLVLMLAGTWIRVLCYRALGTLFTFEVTMRPSHRLIVTGPYAYVRHPSYLGTLAEVLGFIMLHLSPGGWNSECHIMSTPGGWAVRAYLGVIVFGFISSVKRGRIEDELLRDKFGSEWELYRNNVPWKCFPGIY